MALLSKPKPAAAKPALKGKLAAPAAKPAAKPGKALAAKAPAAKAEKLTVKVNDTVTFNGYKDRPDGETPIFEVGDRLVLVEKGKDTDSGQVFFAAVKEADAEAYKTDPESVNGDQVYPREIEKAEKAEVDQFAMTIIPDATVDAMIEAAGGDVLIAAVDMQEQTARGTFYLGGLLQRLYANRAYMEYSDPEHDYSDDVDPTTGAPVRGSGWDKFCRINFNENGRKLYEGIGIYRTYAAILSPERLADVAANKKIGWVKLKDAKGAVTADNVEEILAAAAEQNIADFRATIATDYVAEPGAARTTTGGGSAKAKRTLVKLTFYEDQAEAINYVTKTAGDQFGTTDLNQIYERIVLSWAADNLNEAQNKKALKARRDKIKALKSAGTNVDDRNAELAALEEFLEARVPTEEAAAE